MKKRMAAVVVLLVSASVAVWFAARLPIVARAQTTTLAVTPPSEMARDDSLHFEKKEAAPKMARLQNASEVAEAPPPEAMPPVATPLSGLSGRRVALKSIVGYGRGVGGGGVGLGSMGGSVGLRANVPSVNDERMGSGDAFQKTGVNNWTLTEKDHLSTFAADVDTASYALGRRVLLTGQLPPTDSVRVEEWVNYFKYSYPQPSKPAPMRVSLDAAPHPFVTNTQLLRVGIQGRSLDLHERKAAHLTFLVDVSGSMSGPDRLPLAKRALRMLVDQLHDNDTVALVTYAGNTRLVLAPTGMDKKAEIHAAIEDLSAGGGTAMSSGVDLAYAQAVKQLDGHSVSRVILVSDGDANIGDTTHEVILKKIAGHVKEGVTLTTVGFGMGNYKSELMEQFADKGNGNHYYVDSLLEAKRVFVQQLGGMLEVIAKDVKIQVDFDPAQVNAYRLVGYENRDIADHDFRNDKIDAGEIGSGHTVTALYEVQLKAGATSKYCTVRIRAKEPNGEVATEHAFSLEQSSIASSFDAASSDFRFATAVMAAAEVFRRSPHAAEWSYTKIQQIAAEASTGMPERVELLHLLERAQSISGLNLATR